MTYTNRTSLFQVLLYKFKGKNQCGNHFKTQCKGSEKKLNCT